ncbi:MAG TPA: hypothetical protein VFS40_05970 [Gemmatimonadales bacterium]|nr:hypothetical protein [Gemmatimonadales bacterium]
MPPRHRIAAAALLVVTLAACGKGRDADPAGDPAATDAAAAAVADSASVPATAAATSDAPPQRGGPATVRPEDVDKVRTGLQAELELHQQAAERLRKAKSGTDTLAAMGAAVSGEVEERAAGRAGLPVERYRELKRTIRGALNARQMGESPMMKEMAQTDTSGFTPEQRAQFRENMRQMQAAWGEPFKDFSPETRAKLEAEGAQLDSLAARVLQAQFKAAGQ